VNDDYRYPYSLISLPVLQETRNPPAGATASAVATSPDGPTATAEAMAPLTSAPVIPPNDPTRFVEQKLLEGKVIEALREIFDPEIPVNIYELGLIYGITVLPDNTVQVKMTLTAPACPVAGSLPGEVEKKIEAIPEVKSASVELVWEPPWSRDLMSEAALLTLGML
jgi:FeS assembly SUF system protein